MNNWRLLTSTAASSCGDESRFRISDFGFRIARVQTLGCRVALLMQGVRIVIRCATPGGSLGISQIRNPQSAIRNCVEACAILLVFALGSTATLRSQPESDDEDGAPRDEAVAAAELGLSEEDLAARREALEEWTFEPVALEGTNYLLRMDRRNARFVLRDLRTGVKWYSSWGRKGFASMLLVSAPPQVAGTSAQWVPIDQVRRLVAGGPRIRFSAGPSVRGTPSVDFVLKSLPGGRGLRLEYEVPLEHRERIQAVRLFDDCFWVSDADDGAIVLPRGLGEQLDAGVREPVRRRLSGTPLLRPATSDAEPASLSVVGLLKKKNALLVRWFETFTAVEVERRAVDDAAFPGTYGVFLSLESGRPKGAVEVYTLGTVELGAVDVTRGYRELLGDANPATLRFKTGVNPEHRSFVGAPLFRPTIGSRESKGSSFDQVAEFAAGLKERLDIDRAAFVLHDALRVQPRAGDRPAMLAAHDAAGGEDGLVECSRAVRKLGYLIGVEVPMSLVDEYAAAARGTHTTDAEGPRQLDVPPRDFVGPLQVPEARVWARRRELLEEADPLSELQDTFDLDLLFTRENPVRLGEYEAAPVIDARALFYQRVLQSFDLVGVSPGTELDVGKSVYLGGYFEAAEERWSTSAFFPLLPAAFSHSVRFGGAPTAPLQADDPKGVLFHLLLGEVPLYATPGASDDWRRPARKIDDADPRWIFARDAGWAEGKGLSTYDVFLRNTYEVLSHVARYRGRAMMLFHNRLTPDGSVRETYFGQDMRIVVNVGDTDYEDEEDELILPPYGFFVRYPFFLAFHALRVNGHSYDRPVFYVIRSLEGKMIYRAKQVNIYRGFGSPTLHLGGKRHEVPRQIVTRLF